MQIVFESRDPEGAQMRELAVSRVRFTMRRLSWLVPRATVHLSDINGPRGGIDKRCQLELKTDNMGTVVVTSMAHDWRSAIESALSRAARTLVRSWRRGNQQHLRTRELGAGRADISQRHTAMGFDG
jgi:ribosome-associated translation inhibitor RaiA